MFPFYFLQSKTVFLSTINFLVTVIVWFLICFFLFVKYTRFFEDALLEHLDHLEQVYTCKIIEFKII